MSDDDLWRPKEPADHPGAGPPGARDAPEMPQPITGSGSTPPADSADPGPSSAPPPPAAPGPSYGAPSGPGAVPPPSNPYGYQPGQPGAYPPPPNPYPQPQEYANPQSPYGVPYQPAYAGGALPDHPSDTTAMVLGIIGLVGLLFCGGLTLLLSPFAWATGAKSVREIDAQPGRYGGRDRAQAGKWMGIIGTVLLILGVVLGAFLVIVGIAASNDDPTFGNNDGTFQNG